jgi:acyl-coenzyme A thioesterase PaaI-like protein
MSSNKQGFYSRFRVTPNMFRHFMNCWPPFIGMRIHIEHIAPDWRYVRMRMKLGMRNKNYVGTHFGGGLFTMTDPYFMIMMMHQLGSGYLVWDKSAKIDFVSPGRTTVYADFRYSEAQIEEVKRMTADGKKFEPTYAVDVVDTEGKVVARVEKTLYIRLKKDKLAEKPQSGA